MALIIDLPTRLGPKPTPALKRRKAWRQRPQAKVLQWRSAFRADYEMLEAATQKQQAYQIYLQASALDEQQDPMGALKLYQRALLLDPTLAIALTNAGNCYFYMRQYSEAERCYRAALEKQPNQPEAHYNLGYITMDRDDLTQAVVHFHKAIELDPGFADAHYNLAMAQERLAGMVTLPARRHYQRFIQLKPHDAFADDARRKLAQ